MPIRNISQQIPLIACSRYRIRQIFGISAIIAGYLRFSAPRKPHESLLRMQSIARPLDADRFGKDILADFHAIARVFSEQNGICSRLHDKRMTEAADIRIVKGAHCRYRERNSYPLAFFWRKRPCLAKCRKLPLRLSKPPLRRGEIYLYHLFPRAIALISDRHLDDRILFFKYALRRGERKICITESVPERVNDFFGTKRKKITIPDVNIFEMNVARKVAERKNGICRYFRSRHGKSSRRRRLARQKPRRARATLLSALPDQHYRSDLIPTNP